MIEFLIVIVLLIIAASGLIIGWQVARTKTPEEQVADEFTIVDESEQ